MQIRTQRDLIKSLPNRFSKQYPYQDIVKELEQINLEVASIDEINAVKPNGFHESWTHFYCACCLEYKEEAVEVSQDAEDNELNFICFDCINEMHKLITQFYGDNK